MYSPTIDVATSCASCLVSFFANNNKSVSRETSRREFKLKTKQKQLSFIVGKSSSHD